MIYLRIFEWKNVCSQSCIYASSANIFLLPFLLFPFFTSHKTDLASRELAERQGCIQLFKRTTKNYFLQCPSSNWWKSKYRRIRMMIERIPALKLELSTEGNLTLPIMEHAKVMIVARPMYPRARHVTARHRQDGGASSTRPITGRANCFPS